jgi:hypothetical protein
LTGASFPDKPLETPRAYLERFIREHENASAFYDSATVEHPSLKAFSTIWKSSLKRHTALAQQTLDGLPDTASNLGLALIAGAASLMGAALIRWRRGTASS